MRNDIEAIKRIIYFALWKLQADRLFRHINQKKVLILAYHGITDRQYKIAPWTQIHLRLFKQQMRYIKRRYTVISLKDAVDSIRYGKDLPQNSVVITFDDGYRNNLTTALPVLEKFRIPATIFVTAGYVGSSKILPSDEVYITLLNSKKIGPINIPEMGLGPLFIDTPENLLDTCLTVDKNLKKFPAKSQVRLLSILRRIFGYNLEGDFGLIEDCRLLSWDDIRVLLKKDFIQIGAHTVSHEILTNVSHEEARREIIDSKSVIEEKLNCRISMFAYPNGTAADYDDNHIEHLKENGFICGMTTIPKLNNAFDNPYHLGRFSIGHNSSSRLSNFSLRVSGAIAALKSLNGDSFPQ